MSIGERVSTNRGPLSWAARLQRGFTLWELILVLVLAGIVAVIAVQPLTAVFNLSGTLQEELDAKADITYAVQRIRQEVRFTTEEDPCDLLQIEGGGSGVDALTLRTGSNQVIELYRGEGLGLECSAPDSTYSSGSRGEIELELNGFHIIRLTLDGSEYTFGVTKRDEL